VTVETKDRLSCGTISTASFGDEWSTTIPASNGTPCRAGGIHHKQKLDTPEMTSVMKRTPPEAKSIRVTSCEYSTHFPFTFVLATNTLSCVMRFISSQYCYARKRQSVNSRPRKPNSYETNLQATEPRKPASPTLLHVHRPLLLHS
jgi:hypothetical protein